MSEGKTKLSKTALIIILLFAGGFLLASYLSPYLTAWRIKQATEEKNVAVLSKYIDYPSLRKSIKENFARKSPDEAIKNKKKHPFKVAIGILTPTPILNPVIDFLVTPKGLASMLKGNTPELDENGHLKKTPETANKKSSTSLGYHKLNTFLVKVKRIGGTHETIDFIFYREGLFSWKLFAIYF